MDVQTAFLNGYFDKVIYMNQPEGFVSPGEENKLISLSRYLSLLCMGSIFFSVTTFFLSFTILANCETIYQEFIYPNYSASSFQFVDSHGVFLRSQNGTFSAAFYNPAGQQSNYYLCVIHVGSGTVIWSARDSPISRYGGISLSPKGLTVTDLDSGGATTIKWSTPPLNSSVTAMHLTDIGNLVLLDHSNHSIWQSFDNATDTIVMGQQLSVGSSLSAFSGSDLSLGDYQFLVGNYDGLLQWKGLTYWKLSMEQTAYCNAIAPISYMVLNATGLFLLGESGSIVVIQVSLSPTAQFRIAKLDSGGQFSVKSFSPPSKWTQEFITPSDSCQIPYICGSMGLCTASAGSGLGVCSCPTGFRSINQDTRQGCLPSDQTHSLAAPCNSNSSRNNTGSVQSNSSMTNLSYTSLGDGLSYFENIFSDPIKYVNFSYCQLLCSNCTCRGFFYSNSSGSCFLLENQMGSLFVPPTGSVNSSGYIKVMVRSSLVVPDGNTSGKQSSKATPVVALVLLPSTGFFLLIILLLSILWWRKRKLSTHSKLDRRSSTSSLELDELFLSIPGLPVRFDYQVLEAATNYFENQIGSGGFGSVYKGVLPDKSIIAVKKINHVGSQGRKEFFTEIAVIGNIHHINLVKLKGFCAGRQEQLLVYEYMNRGSLDRTLFGNGPVLEWKERFEIALGTARGLAYLHSGCEQKIIHCDVKPENILLHDHSQVKISDFGLSKLLSPEQSSHFTTMRGTRGYLAPEWLTSSSISEKTDVYSYGMVILELIRGRKNSSMQTQTTSNENGSSGDSSTVSSMMGPVYFPLYALEMHEQGSYLELADPRLEGRVTSEDVEKLVRVALCCVHEEPMLRPNMVNVVAMLEGGISLGIPRLESLNFLRFYGRRFTEASMIEGSNGVNAIRPYPQGYTGLTSNSSSSYPSLSYISSQEVSGPR
ncbi:G-type lectin S-receptor-like serine/threonine-protein kinase At5g35370 [Telopea speciosissima]|uniref:G-type lectin S-receptor-like serine/threonine-protein kinase At5g35370 n=1 Tax=Telopea speciosissima TaxID=54955 RepID=UPI001CC35D82|nr:G-type lectin S-receptor-like serine/threonine-protein kinase At5g35370 [Telopea speciosissima]